MHGLTNMISGIYEIFCNFLFFHILHPRGVSDINGNGAFDLRTVKYKLANILVKYGSCDLQQLEKSFYLRYFHVDNCF